MVEELVFLTNDTEFLSTAEPVYVAR